MPRCSMGSAAEVLNTRSNLTDCITLNVSVSIIVYPLLDIASSMVVNKSCVLVYLFQEENKNIL